MTMDFVADTASGFFNRIDHGRSVDLIAVI